jgi:sec-independent protein translocase protein TatA
MNLGPTELIIILVIVMLLFGASRLPKLARSLGEASKEFKDGVKDGGKDGLSKATDAVSDKLDGKA